MLQKKMAQRLRMSADPPTGRLDSMDMDRTEFGRNRTDPSSEYLNTPNEPIAQTNGELVLKINIFSSMSQAAWHPGLPLMFNTNPEGRALRCMDIFDWQMMMYDQSVRIAAERIERDKMGMGNSSHKRFMEKVEDYFHDPEEMAATWRFGGALYAQPSPYGRDGPYENNFNQLEGQVLSAPVSVTGCIHMTNMFRTHREIPAGAECYMLLKMVALRRVTPPFRRDNGIISLAPSEIGAYIEEDRCMVAVFVWTRGGIPEEADPATAAECARQRKDPPLYCRSYLDFAKSKSDNHKLTREGGNGKTRPVIREAPVFLMGKTMFSYINKNYHSKKDDQQIEIPGLRKTTKEAGEQINLYLPPVQRVYC